MKKLTSTLVLGAAALLYTPQADAATRTVCFSLNFREGRDTSSSPSDTETGNKRGRHADNTATPAVGHLFELWDKDSTGSDEFIGRFIKTTDGEGCATFEWENSVPDIDLGEANPDVYVKYINEVRHTGLNGDKVRALDETASSYPVISWRNGDGTDPDAFVAVNCQAGAPCDLLPAGSALAITASNTTDRSDRVLALDTAQRALETFNAEFDGTASGVIEMVFPCVNGTTPNTTCPGGGSAQDRGRFIINTGAVATNGRSSAHELGHLLMFTEFHRDGLAFDYSLNGSGWSRTGTEFESAAVMEAWADFSSAVSWWDDNNSGSLPRVAGLGVETAAPINATCSANSGIELQSVKGFWDLVDSNNEAAAGAASWADSFNTSPRALSDAWDRFASGTGNRDDNEPSGGDSNGRNLRDFYHNNSSVFGTGFFTSLMNHNCTGTQDNG
ncbi:MAG: hypothetical protein RIT81_40340 [Deltaproteobacteria bacterium]